MLRRAEYNGSRDNCGRVGNFMAYNARLGLKFFFVYALAYAGFVAVCTFRYDWMSVIVFQGLNLAIVYGMGLILLAIVMSVIYMRLCKADEPLNR